MRQLSAWLVLCLLVSGYAFGESVTPDYTYSSRGQGLFRLGNTGYLVESVHTYLTNQAYSSIRKNAANLNKAAPADGAIKKYIYFIESSRSVNLNSNMSGENGVYARIKAEHQADGYGTLALDSPEDYINYFYKSDHHWNYKGSYRGYCDIIRMILGDSEPLLQPAETVVFPDIPYNGSYNSRLGYYKCDELFTVYRFEGLKEYTALINGSPEKKYGYSDTYFRGKYPRITVFNHYGKFYGGDAGELILKMNQPDKPNLLIFSNSYSNAVLLLLAQHFNSVHRIDLRFYKQQMHTSFNIHQYIKKHQINIVLEMGDITQFVMTTPLE